MDGVGARIKKIEGAGASRSRAEALRRKQSSGADVRSSATPLDVYLPFQDPQRPALDPVPRRLELLPGPPPLSFVVGAAPARGRIDFTRPMVALRPDPMLGGPRRGEVLFPLQDEPNRYVSVASSVPFVESYRLEPYRELVPLEELLRVVGAEQGIKGRMSGSVVALFKHGEPLYGGSFVLNDLLRQWDLQSIPSEVISSPASALRSPTIEECESGIVCDSLDEVEGLLREYARGVEPDSNATKRQFYDETHESLGPGLMSSLADELLAGHFERGDRHLKSYVDGLIRDLRARDGQSFRRSCDYGGVGPFFQTDVVVERVGSRFLLRLEVGSLPGKPNPEQQLAARLNRPRALRWVEARFPLAPTSTGWAKLELAHLGLSTNDAESLAEGAAQGRLAGVEVQERNRTGRVFLLGLEVLDEAWLYAPAIQLGTSLYVPTRADETRELRMVLLPVGREDKGVFVEDGASKQGLRELRDELVRRLTRIDEPQ